MWEGGGGQDGVELGGGDWDNCNSIINKYILKKEEGGEWVRLAQAARLKGTCRPGQRSGQ